MKKKVGDAACELQGASETRPASTRRRHRRCRTCRRSTAGWGRLRALTLHAVATWLPVTPASSYSRVGSVDDLFDLALDVALTNDLDVAQAVAGSKLAKLMLTYYRHLVKHRWACQAIAMLPPRGPVTCVCPSGCVNYSSTAAQKTRWVRPMRCRTSSSAARARLRSLRESHAPVDTAIAPRYARLHAGYHDADAEKTVTAGLSALLTHFGRALRCSSYPEHSTPRESKSSPVLTGFLLRLQRTPSIVYQVSGSSRR